MGKVTGFKYPYVCGQCGKAISPHDEAYDGKCGTCRNAGQDIAEMEQEVEIHLDKCVHTWPEKVQAVLDGVCPICEQQKCVTCGAWNDRFKLTEQLKAKDEAIAAALRIKTLWLSPTPGEGPDVEDECCALATMAIRLEQALKGQDGNEYQE